MLLVGLGLIGSFASVALALAISGFIENIDHRKTIEFNLYVWFIVGLVLKIAIPFLQERIAATVSSRTKSVFRKELVSVDYSRKNVSPAEVSILITRGLDALDAYFGKFLPQFIYTLVITPIIVVLFFFVDPLSALILVVTIPLIPLFMVFIGRATKTEQDRQLESLTRLSSHFSEVVRGISTLKLFGRIQHQSLVLQQIGDDLRTKTMKVLRISFLSGFALELAASLSVALMAVTIGFRLIDGVIPFSTAMFLLILAPDAYLPLRMIGANYHASTEGIAAASKMLDILDATAEGQLESKTFVPGLEIWLGPSGVGKSQTMYKLVGGDSAKSVAWMPQQPSLFPGTVLENITGGEAVDQAALEWSLTASALRDVLLNQVIDDFGNGLSGGQAQRVSLARALYRLKTKGLNQLLLDEPTSSLDEETGEVIWKNLEDLAESSVAVIAITHQEKYAKYASRVVRFEA
jgi:ATP-binding cassette subfamily C protein CydD